MLCYLLKQLILCNLTSNKPGNYHHFLQGVMTSDNDWVKGKLLKLARAEVTHRPTQVTGWVSEVQKSARSSSNLAPRPTVRHLTAKNEADTNVRGQPWKAQNGRMSTMTQKIACSSYVMSSSKIEAWDLYELFWMCFNPDYDWGREKRWEQQTR